MCPVQTVTHVSGRSPKKFRVLREGCLKAAFRFPLGRSHGVPGGNPSIRSPPRDGRRFFVGEPAFRSHIRRLRLAAVPGVCVGLPDTILAMAQLELPYPGM